MQVEADPQQALKDNFIKGTSFNMSSKKGIRGSQPCLVCAQAYDIVLDSTNYDDPLEKAEATKEKQGGQESAMDGMVGEKELDKAIGGEGADPEVTSGQDDPLEKAEAAKEKK